MIFLISWIIGIAVGIITTILNRDIRTLNAIAGNLLFYQLTITLTLTSFIGFWGHVFKSDMIADFIGWQKGSFFQKELGYAELGQGIAGLLCIWMGREFYLATIVILSPLYVGATIVHIQEMIKSKNFKPGNAFIVIPDLLMPFTLILLYYLSNI
ncbi:DUF6790 family protein [Clostridium uliginosum]|uniref:DoxX-like family protein n=1 Tax=Clostridium uliginosum TaxID=119641 RepID=A0A1I1SHE0_9CLOT|nr:DUF6790 family protein [Clostridium uliginosum]SFD45899.1 hypothetical protein SAMN05421842_1528 [Clostridium uliginosum]